MYKINNLGETLSYMIRLDAYDQQSLFFSYKRTKQQTLKIMKISTDFEIYNANHNELAWYCII